MAKLTLLLLYNCLLPIGVLLMAPAALKKLKARGGSMRDLWQRFGFFRAEQKAQIAALRALGPLTWVHAASVGEVGIAAKLIHEWRRQQPDSVFVLTTTTPTGYAQALALKEATDGSVLPLFSVLDTWFSGRRFLKALCPQMLVLVEAEVWPNLSFACERRKIPMMLVNARLSPRSERRFRKAGAFSKALFCSLDHIFVQEPEDVDRWRSLGVPQENITCSGSIKFDFSAQPAPEAQITDFQSLLFNIGWGAQDPVLLAASTHPGEEVALAEVYKTVRQQVPNLRFIAVPRHVERAAEIKQEISALGLSVQLRTDAEPLLAVHPDVLLVNTTGELGAWQYLASAVVIGKSFLATGGQNPTEAIMAGKPVLFGPHMENFDILIRQLLDQHGAVQVPDLDSLATALTGVLLNPTQAAALTANGLKVLRAHEGATQRTVQGILGQKRKEKK